MSPVSRDSGRRASVVIWQVPSADEVEMFQVGGRSIHFIYCERKDDYFTKRRVRTHFNTAKRLHASLHPATRVECLYLKHNFY